MEELTRTTKKQEKFVKEIINNGGHATDAAIVAYNTGSKASAASIASQELRKPAVAELLKAELERQGITPETIIAPVVKGLTAKKYDGTDDLSTQLSAHDRAVKIMGLTEKADKNAAVNFNINRASFGGEFVKNDD